MRRKSTIIQAYLIAFLLAPALFHHDGIITGPSLSMASSGSIENEAQSSNTCESGSSIDCVEDDSAKTYEELKSNNAENDNEENGSVTSPWAFMEAFSKLGTSWNHVIGEYRSVVGNADGQELKGDVYAVNGLKEAVGLLKEMVQTAKSQSATEEEERAWTFHTTPFKDFGKTEDDALMAFLRWSVVDSHPIEDDDESCQLIGMANYQISTSTANNEKINVSKAFRRLTSYVHWMESVSSHLLDPPLSYASISPSLSIFSLRVTHDSCGRLVWWVNLGKTQTNLLRDQSPKETIRLFVWVAHLLFLDEGAQTNGLVVIDDMGEIGFWDYMTMLPVQVGISIDRFLISVTPLKAKNVVLMHRPRWVEIAYSLLSWFLTSKMKKRVTMIEKGDENEMLEKIVGGTSLIPANFGDFEGDLIVDIVGKQHGHEIVIS
mmetsp:Transcript_20938/g.43097  ORF Transcript_20938/g.43097 Transcript_20938/m.43097 type:complete len:433 (+) Transcript_20938:3-1301(+)